MPPPNISPTFARMLICTQNVVLIGGPGTGKTHVATALGIQAIEHHRRKVRFFSTIELVNALEQEKIKGKAGHIAEAMTKLDFVILDELGYHRQASPDKTMRMIEAVGDYLPMNRLTGHFHDTDNLAIENVAGSLEMGVRTFDSSIGGLGGCPYAPGAKGNLSTSSLVTFLEGNGFATGIDPELLTQAGRFVSGILARESQNEGERP